VLEESGAERVFMVTFFFVYRRHWATIFFELFQLASTPSFSKRDRFDDLRIAGCSAELGQMLHGQIAFLVCFVRLSIATSELVYARRAARWGPCGIEDNRACSSRMQP